MLVIHRIWPKGSSTYNIQFNRNRNTSTHLLNASVKCWNMLIILMFLLNFCIWYFKIIVIHESGFLLLASQKNHINLSNIFIFWSINPSRLVCIFDWFMVKELADAGDQLIKMSERHHKLWISLDCNISYAKKICICIWSFQTVPIFYTNYQ